MLVRNRQHAQSDIEALFPGQPEPLLHKKAADLLQSQLINGFESAVEQGMRPADALAIILSWVSSEMGRVGLDKTNTS